MRNEFDVMEEIVKSMRQKVNLLEEVRRKSEFGKHMKSKVTGLVEE